jgi:hypothetical protein
MKLIVSTVVANRNPTALPSMMSLAARTHAARSPAKEIVDLVNKPTRLRIGVCLVLG